MQRNSGGIREPAESGARERDGRAFAQLFRDAYRKCFSTSFVAPLTESESHRFSADIEESTGLEIGWKSLKNYSGYLLGGAAKPENPSVPTLDTLARYVAEAPRTSEEQRRAQERHYPYWFRYRNAVRQADPERTLPQPDDTRATPVTIEGRATLSRDRRTALVALVVLAAAVLGAWIALRYTSSRGAGTRSFTDEFDDVSSEGLASRGWSVQSLDPANWTRRTLKPGHLTLFTLPGDNWPQPGRSPIIRNLLVRRTTSECFVAELRLTTFVPRQNWQQAGIILLEDTAFAGRSARMSIGYNDFSGGFPQTKEIIVQAITALGRESSKPEEIVHHRLFVVEPATDSLVRRNLGSSALRIEKRGTHLRLLASAGAMNNAAFKEVGRADFDFRPAYVGVFALEGFVSRSDVAPAFIDAFSLSEVPCSP